MQTELFSREFLTKIREKFHYVESSPYAGRRIFFDSVSGSLRLKKMGERAAEEVVSYAQKSRVDPASEHFARVKNQFKQDAKLFLGAESGYIMPAMSGTHALYRCVNAVCAAAEAGENIVTTSLDHPAAYEATHQFAQKYDLERRVADFDRKTGKVLVEDVLDKIDKNTRLLVIIHGSNVTGAVNDIKRIVKKAREKNPDIYVVVDGVQYAPHGLIDVEKLDVDAYVISGYKIYCKKGSGIAYINERFDELPHWQFRERPAGEWALGAEDESTYAGFSAVIDYLKWMGRQFSDSQDERVLLETAMEKIKAHTRALLQMALTGTEEYTGLRHLEGIRVLGFADDFKNRTGLIAWAAEDYNAQELAEAYFEQGNISLSTRERNIYGRHVLKTLGVENLVRTSLCHYNSPREVSRFLQVTTEII